MTRPIKFHRSFKLESYLCAALVELICFNCAFAQGDPTFFPTNSQFVDPKTGAARINPNTRQLTNPISGRPDFSGNNRTLTDPATGKSTFQGYSRKLTDPVTGASTFTGYSIKLTDPTTGGSTFKGYGQNPLMKDRQSAPDFHWNSNVDSSGKSQYTGFSQNPLTTVDGKSTFIGNNRKLTDEAGRPTFIGNTRQLVDTEGRNIKGDGAGEQGNSQQGAQPQSLEFRQPTFDTESDKHNGASDDKFPDDKGRSEVEHYSSDPQDGSGF